MKSYLVKDGWVVNSINNTTRKRDLLIKGGKFCDLGEEDSKTESICAKGKYVMPGLLDLRCHLRQPGVNFKKSVDKISRSAASGGFTSILAMPELSSMADSPETIKYTQDSIIKEDKIKIHLTGCLTMGSLGKNLAPLGSLKEAGVISVTDCPNSPQDNQIFCKAIEYASMFNLPIIDLPRDLSLSPEAAAHESLLSLKLGLKGFPRMAEELYVSRAILLAKYTEAKIHLTSISSEGSVNLIQKAKQEGISITSDVTSNQLYYTEECIRKFDSFAKALPPFREKTDQDALLQGILTGSIDCISSGHQPYSFQDKSKEFDLAPAGTLGLENAFLQIFEKLKLNIKEKLRLIAKVMSTNPCKIMNLEPINYKRGTIADFFIFDPNGSSIIQRNYSDLGGINLPEERREFKGSICQTFVNGKILHKK